MITTAPQRTIPENSSESYPEQDRFRGSPPGLWIAPGNASVATIAEIAPPLELIETNNIRVFSKSGEPDSHDVRTRVTAKSIALQNQDRRQAIFELFQIWEGTVVSRPDGGGIFTATLRDLTNESLPREEIDLLIGDVDPADQPLVDLGAIFYLMIEHSTSAWGQITRVCRIRFRRLVWTENDVTSGKQRANRFMSLLPRREDVGSQT